MKSGIPSFYFFVLLTFAIAQNSHQALLPQLNNILNRATLVTQVGQLALPTNAVGPLGTAFDSSGVGPYTGISNGKILKYTGPSTGFVDFAVTSQNWSKQLCESTDRTLEPICGRPIGISFYKKTGTLYICDAYFGLRSVGPNGGVATLIAQSAEGVPFNLTSGLSVDQDTGVVYFTDVSTRFQLKDLGQATVTDDRSGRFMKYDLATKQVTVLLRNLNLPVDSAISKDGTFVLVSEFSESRILRYWLKGPKANTSEVFFSVPAAFPGAIRINANGNFWVAFSIGQEQLAVPFAALLDTNGEVLKVLSFTTAGITTLVTNVQEFNGMLYLGSFVLNYVGVTKTTTD